MQFAYSVLHPVMDSGLVEEAHIIFSFFYPFEFVLLVPIDRFLFTYLVELVH